ncbi:MAG: DUF4416 family protein [Desulfarculales bacterium]|jgi:hypothetical protein|nr:DUF4416 family protein [Desulfarculales bacterium]
MAEGGGKALVISLLSNNEPARRQAVSRLAARFGPVAMLSGLLPFTGTEYYAPEMGTDLKRRLLMFSHLVKDERLAVIKHICISLENDLRAWGKRLVNIDPGLMGQENLLLATTKPKAHRLPLGRGIYGEVTLLFQYGGFLPLPWTYPDYAGPPCRELLAAWRRRYLWTLSKD